jgi:hypothetical protein
MVGFFYAVGQFPLFPSSIFVLHRCVYGCKSVYSILIYIILIHWWIIFVMMTWFNPIHNFIWWDCLDFLWKTWLRFFMNWSLFPTIMFSVGWFSLFCENHWFRFLGQVMKITPILFFKKNFPFWKLPWFWKNKIKSN